MIASSVFGVEADSPEVLAALLADGKKIVNFNDEDDEGELGDPISEAILEHMDQDNKRDFDDVEKAVKHKRKTARIAHLKNLIWRAKAKAKTKGRGRGRGKGKGKGEGGGAVVVELPVDGGGDGDEPLPAPAVAVAPPPVLAPVVVVPPPPAAAAEEGAGNVSISWGKFNIVHRQAAADRSESYFGKCPYHQRDNSSCGTGWLYCTREITVGKGMGHGLDSAQTLRKLKEWLISGDPLDFQRKEHMKMYRQRTLDPNALMGDAELEQKRIDNWDVLVLAAAFE
jgi:hypothetical protein